MKMSDRASASRQVFCDHGASCFRLRSFCDNLTLALMTTSRHRPNFASGYSKATSPLVGDLR